MLAFIARKCQETTYERVWFLQHRVSDTVRSQEDVNREICKLVQRDNHIQDGD